MDIKNLLLSALLVCWVYGEDLARDSLIADLEKYVKRDQQVTSILRELLADTENDDSTCKDVVVGTDCTGWKKHGACENYVQVMRDYCRKTCDLCKPPAPPVPDLPACASTPFGCCWDNVTVARGPTESDKESQCLPCLNSNSKEFCDYWKTDCESKIVGQGNVMKKICPNTCGVPCDFNLNTSKCKDISEHCIDWYREKKCETHKEKMKAYCPNICGFCPTSNYIG